MSDEIKGNKVDTAWIDELNQQPEAEATREVKDVIGVVADVYIKGEYVGQTESFTHTKVVEAESFSLNDSEGLEDYDPTTLDKETFKQRYAGLYQTDKGKRLSKSSIRGIWRRFLTHERHDFFKAHKNLTMYDVARVGIDKFIYTMGWFKKTHVTRWRNNKVRIGICAHCQDQFIPMLLQHNFGLCNNCKSLYSTKAARNFMLKQMHVSDRYQHAHRDLLMDFFIMFYNDAKLRSLFLKDSEHSIEYEALEIDVPDWYPKEAGLLPVAAEESSGETDGAEGQHND